MKTVLIHKTGGPEVLEPADIPTPSPGKGEVLIKAAAIGVGMPDVLIRKGTYKWMPPLPTSPGSDMSGTIAAVGEGATQLKVGQKVLLTARELKQRGGCYTEYLSVPEAAPFPLPDTVDLDQAACLPNYQVAWAMIREVLLSRKVRSIFVSGAAGGVGSAAVQLARHLGMTVIGTVSSPEKEKFAREQGADHVLDYKRENVLERVLALTEGKGVDLVLDHVGGAGLIDCLKMLAMSGTLVSFNALAGNPPTDIFAEMRNLLTRGLTLRCFSMHTLDSDTALRRKIMSEVIEYLGKGAIRPIVSVKLPLVEAADAHRKIERGDSLGKILLVP